MASLLSPTLLAGLALSAFAAAAAEPTNEQAVFYREKIAPILSENCFKCHSEAEGKTKGGLALDSRERIEKGGDDGKIIGGNDPAKTMLVHRLLSKDPEEKMPPKQATLTPQQIADLTTWVKLGAPMPATAADGKSAPIPVAQRPNAKNHWAWQPVRSPMVPLVKSQAWVKTPVDSFIASKLERYGFSPSPMADRATLIRRAYFDLVGLPPMPWEVQAFVDDQSPNAWEKVIDRLLASPRYGERWGRYWLDVARYSDTKGENGKKESPLYVDAWTYRDYVIDAFNRDKPYDRFIVEQIAADRLNPGGDKSSLAALGFLTLGDRFNGNKNDVINDRIDVVTKGFLGLTVSCARCHDHMFDPIPQKDYYSLHGIFNSTIEPQENPIIGAPPDAKLYQEYLQARDAAMEGSRKFVEEEIEKTRGVFHQHAGDLLMCMDKKGPDRRKYTQNIGLNAKEVDEMAQWVRRANPGLKRSPIYSAFARFSELPEDRFAEKAPAIVAEITGGDKKRMPVHPAIAAYFKGKSPQSMDDVVGYYNDIFKKLDAPVDPKPAAVLASAVTTHTPATAALSELRSAPFPEGYLKDVPPEDLGKNLPQKMAIRFVRLQQDVTKVEMTHPGAPKRAMAVEDSATPTNSPVFIRGEAQNKGEIVPHRFLEILSGPNRQDFKTGSGRLELAQAIASRSNPLTARVMVNRIWLHHFGDGFVTTPDDFGTQSAPPSHPELLDYLATRFMQSGWSIKTMHKLIMLSAVYQQSSETNPKYVEADPNNRLLWRFNVRRLDFEPIRDSLLYIAGELDQKMGGQPVNILSEPYSERRSVYGYIDRRELPEMMNHFDFANPGLPQGKRHETTVPQQALFMMNSPLMVEVSRKLLDRPEMAMAHTDSQRVHALYWMIFQRAPKPEEIKLGLDYMAEVNASSNPNELPETESKSNTPPTKAQLIAQRKADQGKKKYQSLVLENAGEKVERKPLTAWEKYTHALLMANETIYYN